MTALQENGPQPSPNSPVRAFALCRIAIGAGLMALPGPLLRPWLGSVASAPGAKWLARAAGGRDLALGLGLLFAARRDAPVRGWLEAGMLADTTDAAASLLAVRDLPHGGGWIIAGAALAGAATGRWLVSALPEGSGPSADNAVS